MSSENITYHFHEKKIIFLVILIITVGQSIDIYLPSLPIIMKDFHTSYYLVQFSVTISMIVFGLALLIYGPLSDYFGRRRIALFGINIFLMGSVICVISNSIAMLVIGRAIQGLGIGCAGVVAPATVRDIFSEKKLIKSVSYISMACVITPIIAPALGGYIQHYFNWRACFIYLAIYGLVILILYILYFPETNQYRKKNNLSAMYALKNYISIIKNPYYVFFLFCFVLTFSGETAYVIMAPHLYQTNLKLTPVANGWFMALTVLGLVAGTLIIGKLSNHLNTMFFIFIGIIILLIASLLMLAFLFMLPKSVIGVFLPMSLYMFAAGIIYPYVISGCMSLFPNQAGSAGALMSAFQIGGSGLVASIMMKYTCCELKSLNLFLLIISSLLLIVILLFFYLKKFLPENHSNVISM